ncbi:MAG: carbamoyl-phosphate-synthetase, partial [Alphaproteobacteria bacterium]|nr:carbamoyl-phosphate-synthetase [Alphaproteobacteria bacterium]
MNARADNPGPGVAAARCLAESDRYQVRLIGLAYDALDPGLYLDGLFDATYLLPYPAAGEEAFFERLAAVQAAEKIDVLIPCLDAEIPVCIALADRLAEIGIRTFLPDQAQFSLRAKDRLMEAAQLAAVAVPETQRVSSPSFFDRCTGEGWTWPMVVKGVFYDAVVAHDARQASAAWHRLAAQWGHPVLVQRHVPGEETNLVAVGDGAGGMLGAVMMKKRALTDKGKAWAGVCVHDEAVLDASRRLLSTLKWRGPCEIEGIRDRTGAWRLLEINPRFPAWIYFAHGVGCNLPQALLDMALGRPVQPLPEPRVGSMFIRYAQEVVLPMSAFAAVVTGGGRPQFEEVQA